MTPALFIDCGIMPAYALLPAKMASREATAMILAICLQESKFHYRRQVGGPAKGYSQFEMSGGIFGVLRHEATRGFIRDVLAELNYDDDILTSYTAIEHNDVLCAAYTRLLLWSDPAPLPGKGEAEAAWDYYLRTWRPGKPHPETWNALYAESWRHVNG